MMVNNRFIYIGKALLVLIIICMFFNCSPKDPAEIASQVAREWAANNIDTISKDIANQVAGNNPLLEITVGAAISNEIKQRIVWEYAVPNKLAENRYGVAATALTLMEIPLLGNYKISLNYNLEIDTQEKRVIKADIDTGSFTITKQ